MKTMYKIFVLIGLLVAGTACQDEDRLSPEFDYTGPIPAIAEGPSEAQKICYELFEKYDYHVYYTLTGDDVLRTNVGATQINMLWYVPEEAFPLQGGDEVTSEAFLKLLRSFYDALPLETAKKSAIKRQVLIKTNFWYDELLNYYGIWAPEYYSIAFTGEAQQGIVYWGEMDDEIGLQPDVWKYSICSSFFTNRTWTYVNNDMPEAKEFGLVSAGYYLDELPEEDQWTALDLVADMETGEVNMDFLMTYGFVHPRSFLMGSSKSYQHEDMATFATWIACTPLAERQDALDNYPLVKKKYDLTLGYYKTYLKMDLEEFSKTWLAVIVE